MENRILDETNTLGATSFVKPAYLPLLNKTAQATTVNLDGLNNSAEAFSHAKLIVGSAFVAALSCSVQKTTANINFIPTPIDSHYWLSKVIQVESFHNDYLRTWDYINNPNSFNNLVLLRKDIQKEFEKFSDCLNVDLDQARRDAEVVAQEISRLKFDKVAIELTPSNSIKFTLIFQNQRMLMVTKPFVDVDDIQKNEVLFSFFINRKLVASDSNNLRDLVNGINSYLNT